MLRVGLIVPHGFATLSFAPLSVFEAANLVLEQQFYEVHVTSESGGARPELVRDGSHDREREGYYV